MNLKEIRSRSLEDLLYLAVDILPSLSLPADLYKTDEAFMQSVYSMFCEVEEHKSIMFRSEKKTGYSTAVYFLIAYYALHHQDITLVGRAGGVAEKLDIVCQLFAKLFNFSVKTNKMSNVLIFSHDGKIFCEIYIISAFDVADLKGVVIIDDNRKLSHVDKFMGLMDNRDIYDRLILNFPTTPEIDTLADKYGIKTKEIKIF